VHGLCIWLKALCRHSFGFVVTTRSNTVGTKGNVEILASVGTSPLLDDLEHVAVHLAVHVADGGMVENADNVFQDLLFGYLGMVPGVYDSRRDILENGRCDFAGWLVEDV